MVGMSAQAIIVFAVAWLSLSFNCQIVEDSCMRACSSEVPIPTVFRMSSQTAAKETMHNSSSLNIYQ